MHDVMEKLFYRFSDISLLRRALTHASASKDNNERLEFLGDALLSLIIGEYLFLTFPEMQEGQLSRLRAFLVKGETLALLAEKLHLSPAIITGPGEILVKGKYRQSILAGTMEAMIGAIYCDGGITSCRDAVLHWYQDHLNNLDVNDSHADAKTRLQEFLQARGLSLPYYRVIEQKNHVHHHSFLIACEVEAFSLITQASGLNKKQAEQQAAQLMLEKIIHVFAS